VVLRWSDIAEDQLKSYTEKEHIKAKVMAMIRNARNHVEQKNSRLNP